MSGHQHEEWQMLESAKGGRYCGACGDHEPQAHAIPEAAVEVAARGMAGAAYGLWELVPPPKQRLFLRDARLALEAAAPHMLAGAQADAYEEGFEVAGDRPPAYNPYRRQA